MIGMKAHVARLKKLSGPDMVNRVGAALFAGGEAIQVEAQRSITEGAVSGKAHVPSKPGDPPNNDTGYLAAAIVTIKTAPLEVEVSSNAGYAAALEFGSERKAGKASRSFAGKTSAYGPSKAKHGPVMMEFGGSKTEARPYMAPARDAKRKEVADMVKNTVNDAVRRSKQSGGE